MKPRRFIESVRYTRPKQLLARLRLIAKRKGSSQRAVGLRAELAKQPSLFALREPSVSAFMPMRQAASFSFDDGHYQFCFLNEKRSFKELDWLSEGSSHLWVFHLHYMEYLEEVSDELFVRLVDDWIEKNPAYQERYWLSSWNAFVISIRVVVWLQQYLLRETALEEAFKQRLLASVVQQLRFLKDNLELDLCGNHLLKDLKALIWAGRFFAGAEAESWLALGESLLQRELREQLLPDGLHYERSPAYHAQVFVDLLECYLCLEESPFKHELFACLRLAAQALADTSHPDGLCSQFNDGGLNMAYRPKDCLEAWQKLSGETVKPRELWALEQAGYYGIRQANDYLMIDCGPIGPDYLPGHGHGDIFSFEWSLEGERIVVDSGVFEYSEGEKRSYARSTKAHNSLNLDNQDQCEFWGAFRVARRARIKHLHYQKTSSGFRLSAEHDGFRHLAAKPRHRRSFEVTAQLIQITDEVLGGAGQKAEARLLFHPDCLLEPRQETILISRGKVKVLLCSSAKLRIEKAVYFPDFGKELPCQQIVLDYGTAPCVGNFTLKKI